MFPSISFCFLYDLFCSCVLQQQLPPALVHFLSSLYQNKKKHLTTLLLKLRTPNLPTPNSPPPIKNNTSPKNSQPTPPSPPPSIACQLTDPKRAGGLGLLMSERWDLKLMTSLIFLLAELQGGWVFFGSVSIEGFFLGSGEGEGRWLIWI